MRRHLLRFGCVLALFLSLSGQADARKWSFGFGIGVGSGAVWGSYGYPYAGGWYGCNPYLFWSPQQQIVPYTMIPPPPVAQIIVIPGAASSSWSSSGGYGGGYHEEVQEPEMRWCERCRREVVWSHRHIIEWWCDRHGGYFERHHWRENERPGYSHRDRHHHHDRDYR